MKDENLKIIYDEIVELHRYQQSGVDLLYNKLNWILVSDLVFLAAAYNLHWPNFLAQLLASASAVLVLLKFQPETFKSTAQISAQLDQVEHKDFLESLIKKKKEALNANATRIDKLSGSMLWARILLIAAIAVQFLSILHFYVR
ncbi:MAG: hypothetical protein ACYCPH_00220 [Minisyncoccota bacterium]